jgi:hypothetical protein
MTDRIGAKGVALPTRNPSSICAFVIAVLGHAAILWPNAGKTEGALAVALSKEGAKEGFSFGLSASYLTSDAARAKALLLCQQSVEDEKLSASCKVIESFSGQ